MSVVSSMHLIVLVLIVIFSFPDPTFFSGRCAQVIVSGSVIGKLGVVHPDVIQAFDLRMPVSALEINIEPFV